MPTEVRRRGHAVAELSRAWHPAGGDGGAAGGATSDRRTVELFLRACRLLGPERAEADSPGRSPGFAGPIPDSPCKGGGMEGSSMPLPLQGSRRAETPAPGRRPPASALPWASGRCPYGAEKQRRCLRAVFFGVPKVFAQCDNNDEPGCHVHVGEPPWRWHPGFTPKALHSKAQDRERSERTLGARGRPRQTPTGFHTRVDGLLVKPLRGLNADWSCNPGCAARPWALLYYPVGVQAPRRRVIPQ